MRSLWITGARFRITGWFEYVAGLSAPPSWHRDGIGFSHCGGQAVINAVRFASAFFGRGQFSSAALQERNGEIRLNQSLQAPYYQPLDPPRKVSADEWESVRADRKRTQICELQQSAVITETSKGFRLRLQSHGTKDVPLAVEINFREGGKLEGVVAAPKVEDGWLLTSGMGTYRSGPDVIRFGPGFAEHRYTQIHRAEPKLGPQCLRYGYYSVRQDHRI